MSEHLEPTAEQEAAAASLDADVMLAAGAGTGKTSTLVDRYVRAARREERGVQAILAFTFTEAAAAEMRGRVRDRLRGLLAEAHAAADADEIEKAGRLLADTAEATISTIHGFCQRLLRAHPLAAGIDPGFRVLTEPDARRLASEAFETALASLVEEHGASAVELIAAFNHDRLSGAIAALHDELRSSGRDPCLPRGPRWIPEDEHVSEAVAALGPAALAAANEIEAQGSNGKTVERALAATAEAAEVAAAPADLERAVAAIGSCKPPSPGNTQALLGEAATAYRDAWDRANRLLRDRAAGERYALLAELSAHFARCYGALKAERSALDFEDLQVRTLALLDERPDIRDRLRERFAHVLVDEFQDTNEVQLRLIAHLGDGEGTRVFRVGDRLQSIFGFRHADLAAFDRAVGDLEARKESGEPVELLRLSENFRSEPRLLELINKAGSEVLGDQLPPEGELHAALEPGPRIDFPLELLLTDDPGWKEMDEQEFALIGAPPMGSARGAAAEARALALRLRTMVDEEGVAPKDIVVLLRAFTHASVYEDALARAGLRPKVLGGKGFWSQQQITDLAALLRAISNPLDDEALFGTLASPVVGVRPDTLWLLRQLATGEPDEHGRPRRFRIWREIARRFAPDPEEAPEDEATAAFLGAIPAEDAERLRLFHGRMLELRSQAPLLGLEQLVDAASRAFDYDLAALSLDGGEQRMANVRKLMRIAREFEASEGRDLRAFLEEVRARQEADRESIEVVTAEEHDGVRVMTIHSAKGLEFPVVALPELGRRLVPGGGEVIQVSRESDDDGAPARLGISMARLGMDSEKVFDYESLAAEGKSAAEQEELRLLWVGMTRAQQRLVLSGRIDPTKLGETGPGRPIAEQLAAALGTSAEHFERQEPPAAGRIGISLNAAGADRARELSLLHLAVPAESDAGAELPSELPTEPAPAREPTPAAVSPSALDLYRRCGYRFYAERVLGLARGEPSLAQLADDPGPAGEPPDPPDELDGVVEAEEDEGIRWSATDSRRRFGTGRVVHGLLEASARARWAAPDPAVVEAALRRELGDADAGSLERVGLLTAAWFGSALLSDLREAKATFQPEIPFVLEIEDVTVRGVIDLLCRMPGRTVVVDYKTDRLNGASVEEHADRYEVQRAAYALAAARTAGTEEVETAYVFLERPDEPVLHRFGAPELKEAEKLLAGLARGIGTGVYEVTEHPNRDLCGGCPARWRLCSYSVEETSVPAAA